MPGSFCESFSLGCRVWGSVPHCYLLSVCLSVSLSCSSFALFLSLSLSLRLSLSLSLWFCSSVFALCFSVFLFLSLSLSPPLFSLSLSLCLLLSDVATVSLSLRLSFSVAFGGCTVQGLGLCSSLLLGVSLSLRLSLSRPLSFLSLCSLSPPFSPSDPSSCSVRRCFLFVFPSSFLSLSLSLSLSPSLLSVSVWLCSSAICFLSLRLYVSLSLPLSGSVPRSSLWASTFRAVPQCSLYPVLVTVRFRHSVSLSSLSVLCVKRPAPLLFSSFLFLALAPCLPAFLSSSVPHCPSLSPLCFSLSLSLSLPPSLACSFSLSLSLSLSLCLPLSGLLCLSLVLVPSSHCFSLILGYSV